VAGIARWRPDPNTRLLLLNIILYSDRISASIYAKPVGGRYYQRNYLGGIDSTSVNYASSPASILREIADELDRAQGRLPAPGTE